MMLLFLSGPAAAWEFVAPANKAYRVSIGMEYKIIEDAFSPAEALHIINGVDAWDDIPGSSYTVGHSC